MTRKSLKNIFNNYKSITEGKIGISKITDGKLGIPN
jgi:hypothetical protein